MKKLNKKLPHPWSPKLMQRDSNLIEKQSLACSMEYARKSCISCVWVIRYLCDMSECDGTNSPHKGKIIDINKDRCKEHTRHSAYETMGRWH